MPRSTGPLACALIAALLTSAALAACAPFATDANPTRQPRSSHTATTSGPTPSSSPAPATPSATPTAYRALGPLPDGVAPARPAALDQPPTLEGAKAVAGYFVMLYSYAYQTGDLGAWDSLSDPQCVFCASTKVNSQTKQTKGQHLVGGAIAVTSAQGTEVDLGKFFDLTLTLIEAPSKTVDAAGRSISDTTGDEITANVIVTYDGKWRVREISTKPRGSA